MDSTVVEADPKPAAKPPANNAPEALIEFTHRNQQQYNLRKRKGQNSRPSDVKRVKNGQASPACIVRSRNSPTAGAASAITLSSSEKSTRETSPGSSPTTNSHVRFTRQQQHSPLINCDVCSGAVGEESDNLSNSSGALDENLDSQMSSITTVNTTRRPIPKLPSAARNSLTQKMRSIGSELDFDSFHSNRFSTDLHQTPRQQQSIIESKDSTLNDFAMLLRCTSEETRLPANSPSQYPIENSFSETRSFVSSSLQIMNNKVLPSDPIFSCPVLPDTTSAPPMNSNHSIDIQSPSKIVKTPTDDSLNEAPSVNGRNSVTTTSLLAYVDPICQQCQSTSTNDSLYPPEIPDHLWINPKVSTSSGPHFSNIRIQFMICWSYQIARELRLLLSNDHEAPADAPHSLTTQTLSKLTNCLYIQLETLFAYLDLPRPEEELSRSIFSVLRDTMSFYSNLFDGNLCTEFKSDMFVESNQLRGKPLGKWMNQQFASWLTSTKDEVMERVYQEFRAGCSPSLDNYRDLQRDTKQIFVLGIVSMVIDIFGRNHMYVLSLIQ